MRRAGSRRRARRFGLALALAAPACALLARGARADTPPDDESESSEHDQPAPSASEAPTAPHGKAAPPAVVVRDGMVLVPGGRFVMGSRDRKAPPNERPPRPASVGPFWIDRTEVTVGAYRACVDEGRCAAPPRSSATCTWELGDPQLPVSCVRFDQADRFCRARAKRLPREVEWELAARGTEGRRYPWGEGPGGCRAAATLFNDATGRPCSGKRPSPVGAHPAGASPFGVLDLAGNVEEWVADYYAEAVADLAPSAGAARVLRGGGWLSRPADARATSRSWASALEAGPNVGFRCARDLRADERAEKAR